MNNYERNCKIIQEIYDHGFIHPQNFNHDSFLTQVKNTMVCYQEDKKRHAHLKLLTYNTWSNDIEQIYNLRKELSKDPNTSLSGIKLMDELKKSDDIEYAKLKQHLHKKLFEIVDVCTFTKEHIINAITKIIVFHSAYYFIKLTRKDLAKFSKF